MWFSSNKHTATDLIFSLSLLRGLKDLTQRGIKCILNALWGKILKGNPSLIYIYIYIFVKRLETIVLNAILKLNIIIIIIKLLYGTEEESEM